MTSPQTVCEFKTSEPEKILAKYNNNDKIISTKRDMKALVDVDPMGNVTVNFATHGAKPAPIDVASAKCDYTHKYKHILARDRLAKKLEMRRQLEK